MSQWQVIARFRHGGCEMFGLSASSAGDARNLAVTRLPDRVALKSLTIIEIRPPCRKHRVRHHCRNV